MGSNTKINPKNYRLEEKTISRIAKFKMEIGSKSFDILFNTLMDTYEEYNNVLKEESLTKKFDKSILSRNLRSYFNNIDEIPERDDIINDYIYYSLFRELRKIVPLKFLNDTIRIIPNYYNKNLKDNKWWGFIPTDQISGKFNEELVKSAIVIEGRLYLGIKNKLSLARSWFSFDIVPDSIMEIYSDKALDDLEIFGIDLDIEVEYMTGEEFRIFIEQTEDDFATQKKNITNFFQGSKK